jgi:hypothetical protein
MKKKYNSYFIFGGIIILALFFILGGFIGLGAHEFLSLTIFITLAFLISFGIANSFHLNIWVKILLTVFFMAVIWVASLFFALFKGV